MEIRKKATFFQEIKKPVIQKFFKDFINHRKKTDMVGWQFLAIHLSLTFLNTGKTDGTFQQSGKQYSFTHNQYVWKLKFRVLQNHHWNTIRTRRLRQIKVSYDLFNHQKYQAILRVTEICSFGLVLEGKTGEEITKP